MGERLGRYTVLKHLASGGMADVLLARTDGTGDGIEGFARHVVLKRIRAEHANDRRFIDMFLDEARLAATLHHQNIVQVHDIGEADGAYFFAMEYLHGEDVRTILGALTKTRAHLPLEHVVGIVSAAAAGLHYAHERRDIVHRDVSPSNILVGYDGSVKVVDFGIAKAAMRDGETRSGVKGKVSYLSPEQCKLGAVDRRSDVYSLGVVLYELATSTRLFKSDSDYLVMDAICTGKIPAPRVRRPDLPPELTAIVMKALATDTPNRYQTADELRTALDQFAVASKLSTSAPALAAYLKKLFGEKPEPWLEAPAAPRLPDDAKTATGTGRKRNVHDDRATRPTDLPPSTTSTEMAAVRPPTDPGTTTTTDGKAVAAPVQPPVEPAAEHVEPGAAPSPSPRAFTPRTIAMIAVPVAAVLGLIVWKVASSGAGERAPAPSASSASTPSSDPHGAKAREATVAHGSAGASTDIAGGDTAAGAGSASTTGATTASAASATNAATTSAAKGTDARATPKSMNATPAATKGADATATSKNVSATATAKNVSATATAKNVSATATAKNVSGTATAKNGSATATAANSTSATTAPGTGTSATAAATKETSAGTTAAGAGATTTATNAAGSAAGTPKTASGSNAAPAALPKIARVVVDNIATHNRKQIARCEGTEELRGEISIRFEVDAAGRVVKSSRTSTIKNPKVASCLQAAVKSWQFPKTAATGVYTVTYY